MTYTRAFARFIEGCVDTRCDERRLVSVATLIVAMFITASGPRATEQVRPEPVPYVVRAGDTAVGLIYPVETLAALVARQPVGTVSSRITDAVRQQTPVVVMWSIPPVQNSDPVPGPFHIAIVERNEQAFGNPNRIEPLWIQKDAADLAQLDSRTRFEEVGAMAAFPLTAFVRGRKLVIYSHRSMADGIGAHVVTRSGWIDWDPARDERR